MRSILVHSAIFFGSLTIAGVSLADVKKAGSTFEEAEELLARGMLEKAAMAYGAFAQNAGQDPRAPWAFVESANLHMRLGDMNLASAEEKLQFFENTFAPVNIELWSDMVFTMIDGFAMRGDRQAALTLAHRALKNVEEWSKIALKRKHRNSQRLLETELRVRGRLAHFYREVGGHHRVDAEYTRVQKITELLGVWSGKNSPRKKAEFPETMELIAESFFHTAEAKRDEAERLALPAYLGNGDRDSVRDFITGPGKQWSENRRYLVEEANRLYHLVIGTELPKPIPPRPPPPPSRTIGLLGSDPNAPIAYDRDDSLGRDSLEPLPSPKWAIAAAERVGSVWASFLNEYRKIPIPKEWSAISRLPGPDLPYQELRQVYISGLSESPSFEMKVTAKSAYSRCLEMSIRFRIVNEHTNTCSKWLSKNFGAEYHDADDFAPPGEFIAFGQYARPAPLPSFTH